MIEPVSNNNLSDLLPLMKAYQAFYQAENVSDEHNQQFFSQFNEGSDQGCQFLYRDPLSQGNKKAVAFATVFFTFSSTIARKVAVLNDLYVAEEYRAKGIATELIKHCLRFSKARGASRLQWVTAQDNHMANALYQSIGARQSEWNFYVLSE